jgi:hypothetical protein
MHALLIKRFVVDDDASIEGKWICAGWHICKSNVHSLIDQRLQHYNSAGESGSSARNHCACCDWGWKVASAPASRGRRQSCDVVIAL